MKYCVKRKLNSIIGLARIHVILIVIIAVLVVIAAIPGIRKYKYHGEWLLCADSLRVVNGVLTVERITEGEEYISLDTAAGVLSVTLPGRDDYCPAGGTVYFVEQDHNQWKAVCGEHDSDHALRTRLNAAYVLTQLKDGLRKALYEGDIPDRLTVTFNSRLYECRRVTEETGITRGTSSTRGYSGTVIFYGVSGTGEFEDNSAGKAQICYLCFADEDYNANWSVDEGWTGSAYGEPY